MNSELFSELKLIVGELNIITNPKATIKIDVPWLIRDENDISSELIIIDFELNPFFMRWKYWYKINIKQYISEYSDTYHS